jgi:hypothetical protein
LRSTHLRTNPHSIVNTYARARALTRSLTHVSLRVHCAQILAETTIPATAFNGTAKWVVWPIGPVAVGPPTHDLDQEYMVTVSTGTETGHHWSGCPACNAPAGGNGKHLAFPANSARFGAAMGQMPETTPQFGQSYFRDVVFCLDPGPCGPLPPPPPPPHPVNVAVAGSVFVERWVGVPAIGTYRAEVIDQFGTPIVGRTVKWAIEGVPPAGVTISANSADGSVATLVVLSSVVTDIIVINITASDASAPDATITLTVAIAASSPVGVTVTGPTAVRLTSGSCVHHSPPHCIVVPVLSVLHNFTDNRGYSRCFRWKFVVGRDHLFFCPCIVVETLKLFTPISHKGNSTRDCI